MGHRMLLLIDALYFSVLGHYMSLSYGRDISVVARYKTFKDIYRPHDLVMVNEGNHLTTIA